MRGEKGSFHPAMRAAVTDQAFHARMLATLVKRLGDADAEDVLQNAKARAMQLPLPEETTEDGSRALVAKIALNEALSVLRKRRRSKVAAIPDLEKLAAAAPPIPIERPLSVEEAVEEHAELTGAARETFQALKRQAESGESNEQVARSLRISPEALRKRVSLLRRSLREHRAAIIAATGLALLALLFVVQREPEADLTASGRPSYVEPRPAEAASQLRAVGLADCERGAFYECLEELERAARLDPEGEKLPEVKRAREQAERALRAASPSGSAAPGAPPGGR